MAEGSNGFTFGTPKHKEELTSGSILLCFGAIVILVAANAFFVASEFALVTSRRTRIDEMVLQGDRRAKTVQTALPLALNFLGRGAVASVVAVSVISTLHVVIGEQAPTVFCSKY